VSPYGRCSRSSGVGFPFPYAPFLLAEIDNLQIDIEVVLFNLSHNVTSLADETAQKL